MKKEKFDKRIFRKTGDELQAYLACTRRGSKIENRKGKGSYTRKRKHKGKEAD